jgi:PIN domain nuclease of toxin-antitoxin system
MKRILLDTHALIWWMDGDNKLGSNAKEQISNPDNDIYVSAATVWEMSIKQQMGKLVAPDDIESTVEGAGFSSLAISLFHGQQAGKLPLHHKDPFDRMLIAQAQAEGLQILTKDEHFPAYGIRLINASE